MRDEISHGDVGHVLEEKVLPSIQHSPCVGHVFCGHVGRRDGLPLRHLNRPKEYAEFSGLLDSSMYTSGNRTPRRPRYVIYGFVAVSGLLGAGCNLMGPGVAVLVIPTLQWKSVPQFGGLEFTSMAGDSAPNLIAFSELAKGDASR